MYWKVELRHNRLTFYALDVSVSDKNVTSLLDTCLHTTAQKRMVYVIPCTFSKSYYELILIYNFEQKYYTTCSGGANFFVYSILQCTYHAKVIWSYLPSHKNIVRIIKFIIVEIIRIKSLGKLIKWQKLPLENKMKSLLMMSWSMTTLIINATNGNKVAFSIQ